MNPLQNTEGILLELGEIPDEIWNRVKTEEDIEEDSFFWEQLENKLSDIGLWYESGEGDALDIFICGHMEGDDL